MKLLSEKDLYVKLSQLYGLSVEDWWPAESQYERIISSILVQNTTWENTQKSLAQLKSATNLDPQMILDLNQDQLIDLIRPSGFYTNKSKGVRAVTQFFTDYHFDYQEMVEVYGSDLRRVLLDLPNVGPETADTYLLYIFDQKTFIADRYAQKLYQSLGVENVNSYKKLKAVASTEDFSLSEAQHFHALIVEFGKHYLRGKGKFDQSSLADYQLDL